jgi:hypothetical protein
MSKRLALVVVVSWLALGVLIGPSLRGPAHAAQQTKRATVPMATEAWYLSVPPCTNLLDCSPVPPVSPYPKDTLHVAVAAGRELARTYVAFEASLPSSARLTSGRLNLPVDTDPLHGSLVPNRARMEACLATGEFKAVRGSPAAPPAINCETSAPATWNGKEKAFTVELDAFLGSWQSGAGALALVPASAGEPTPDSWHVVFPATPKEGSKAPAIVATLTYSTVGTGSGGPSDIPAPDIPITGGTGVGVGFGPLPQAPAPQPTPLPTAPVVQPLYPGGFAGLGFAYPIVWALPLVIIAGVGALGRALTKELYRRSV